MTTTPEQKANRAKWVAALRSGEYAQTQGTLNRIRQTYLEAPPVGYCCIGVAAEIMGLPKVETDTGVAAFQLEGGGRTGNMPDSWLRDEFGLGGVQRSVLITLNDREHASFITIAAYIESLP